MPTTGQRRDAPNWKGTVAVFRHLAHTLVAAMAILFAACGLLGPEDSVRIEVDSVDLSPTDDLFIRFHIGNNIGRGVWIPSCADFPIAQLELKRDTGWEPFTGVRCRANLSSTPLAVPDGSDVDGFVRAQFPPPGVYRVVVQYTNVFGEDPTLVVRSREFEFKDFF